MKFWKLLLSASAASLVLASAAWAEDQVAASTAAPAPSAPTPPAFSIGMNGPIVINPAPFSVATGLPWLSAVTVNGAITGLGLWQDNPSGGNQHARFDLANAQVLIEKTDGLVQFFIDAGAYSFPTVGSTYVPSAKATNANFGAIPMAYVKLAPTADLSIEVGKLPTLIGAEYNFTFENMNIERGLLWNQENLVNRGVQLNYTRGAFAFNISLNDGYYSNNLSWITGAVAWTINPANTLAFSAGGNFRTTNTFSAATPLYQDNSQMYNLMLTHTDGPWTIVPTIQYTEVPSLRAFGAGSASTFGGALFVDYTVPASAKLGDFSVNGFSLPARFEYIASTGSAASNSASLLYGPGSKAVSLTVTPTYQYKIYYVRTEISYIRASDATPGFAFGVDGSAKSQTRGLLEVGALF